MERSYAGLNAAPNDQHVRTDHGFVMQFPIMKPIGSKYRHFKYQYSGYIHALADVMRRPFTIFLLLTLALCALSLMHLHQSRTQIDLRLQRESNYQRRANTGHTMRVREAATRNGSKEEIVLTTDGSSPIELEGLFQAVVQTPLAGNESDVLTEADLLAHAYMMYNVSRLTIDRYGYKWQLEDVCFKPQIPSVEGDFGQLFGEMINNLTPCTIITPLDCFWEGSWALGPTERIDVGFVLPMEDDNELDWSNLNPRELMNAVSDLASDLGLSDDGLFEVFDWFSRRYEAGYLDRQCLDPLHPDCPTGAPNYRNRSSSIDVHKLLSGGCDGLQRFRHWPEELIIGGAVKESPGAILRSAGAIQSGFALGSAEDIYLRIKKHPKYPMTEQFMKDHWSPAVANSILSDWQHAFRSLVRNTDYNKYTTARKVFQEAYDRAVAQGEPFNAPYHVTFTVKEYRARPIGSSKWDANGPKPMFIPTEGASIQDVSKWKV